MLKQLLAACAGVLISGGMIFAADLTGVFTGESNGQPVAVTLQSDGEVVHGSVSYRGSRFPLVGRETDGMVRGTWRGANGEDFPFAAASDGSSLQMRTNGVNYSLTRGDDNNRRSVDTQEQPAVRNRESGRPTVAFNAQMMQGQVFAFPVPEGWTHDDGTNAAFVVAPDQSMCIGFTGLERVNTGTPVQFLNYMMGVHKIKIAQILSAKQVPTPQGEAVEFVYVTNAPNGMQVKTWARVVIVRGYSSNGYILLASATSDKFDQVIEGLKAMAGKIQCVNQNAAFQRDQAAAVQQNTNYNHPMDHSFADGYWKNQATTAGAMARGSDVRRNSYNSSDPSTGTIYNHTGAAYDPARGGVVNPERPTELLRPEQHWIGHE